MRWRPWWQARVASPTRTDRDASGTGGGKCSSRDATLRRMSAVRKPTRARRGRPPHDDVLTPAEWAIVHAIRHGQSYGSIAARRGISRDAVKYHVRNALAKLGLRGRRELEHWTGVPKDSAAFRRERSEESAMTMRE